jgi:hypothetical protein
MFKRRRFTQLLSLSERLYQDAARLRIQSERLHQNAAHLRMQAEKLPHGTEREKLLRTARQVETANDIGEWLSSPDGPAGSEVSPNTSRLVINKT